MRDGDEGIFNYSIFLPRGSYNLVPSVSTTMGQILSAFDRGNNYDSFPIFAIDTAWPTNEITAPTAEAHDTEQGPKDQIPFDFGDLSRDRNLMDNWIDISVRFGLSSGNDGYVEPTINNRRLGRLTGRTILWQGYLEIRYGLYQTGTNHYPSGASNIPPQVAYYSGVDLLKIV